MRNNNRERRRRWLASAFAAVDPGGADPHYWARFHRTVLQRSLPELVRRRRESTLSLSEVVSSWARTLLPAAAAAAAVGAILISRSPAEETRTGQSFIPVAEVDVEELLVLEVEGETIPATLGAAGNGRTAGSATFASDEF